MQKQALEKSADSRRWHLATKAGNQDANQRGEKADTSLGES